MRGSSTRRATPGTMVKVGVCSDGLLAEHHQHCVVLTGVQQSYGVASRNLERCGMGIRVE